MASPLKPYLHGFFTFFFPAVSTYETDLTINPYFLSRMSQMLYLRHLLGNGEQLLLRFPECIKQVALF